MRRRWLAAACCGHVSRRAVSHAQDVEWSDVLAKAKGQTVNFNAWAGDEKTNAFIQWVGEEVEKRYGVKVNHVKLKDTAEAVTRVVAEKAAGRDTGGTVDLVWINGPNFLAMKQQRLLFGPFTQALPSYAASTPRASVRTSSTSRFPSKAWNRPGGARRSCSSTTANACRNPPRSVPRAPRMGEEESRAGSRILRCAISWARRS